MPTPIMMLWGFVSLIQFMKSMTFSSEKNIVPMKSRIMGRTVQRMK